MMHVISHRPNSFWRPTHEWVAQQWATYSAYAVSTPGTMKGDNKVHRETCTISSYQSKSTSTSWYHDKTPMADNKPHKIRLSHLVSSWVVWQFKSQYGIAHFIHL